MTSFKRLKLFALWIPACIGLLFAAASCEEDEPEDGLRIDIKINGIDSTYLTGTWTADEFINLWSDAWADLFNGIQLPALDLTEMRQELVQLIEQARQEFNNTGTGIVTQAFNYVSTDDSGTPIVLSAMMAYPSGGESPEINSCTLYGHDALSGTPSTDGSELELRAMLFGELVVIPDFQGYGKSADAQASHDPEVLAKQEFDALRRAIVLVSEDKKATLAPALSLLCMGTGFNGLVQCEAAHMLDEGKGGSFSVPVVLESTFCSEAVFTMTMQQLLEWRGHLKDWNTSMPIKFAHFKDDALAPIESAKELAAQLKTQASDKSKVTMEELDLPFAHTTDAIDRLRISQYWTLYLSRHEKP